MLAGANGRAGGDALRPHGGGEPSGARRMNGRPTPGCGRTLAGYCVHLLTASGIVLALLAALEVMHDRPDPRRVFLWLALAILIDAVDGPLARAADVKHTAAAIDGRTIDDIVDYITYTFIPLLLVLRLDWALGPPALVHAVIAAAMIASLLGFAHRASKDERGGFFRGFPSYWNLAAYYFGLWAAYFGDAGRLGVLMVLVALLILTVLPVRFVYPNLAPRPWRRPLLIAALLWGGFLMAMLPWYPSPANPGGAIPAPAMWCSLAYPALYVLASVHLDRRARRGG
jgi:phosphatidylcholine synthase